MKKLLKVLVALPLVLLMNTGFAAATTDMKIGVIDIQKVVQTAPQTKAITSRLSSKFDARKKEIETAQKSIEDGDAKLKRDGSVMSDSDRQALQDKLANQKRELMFKQQTYQEDVVRAQNEEMQKLLDSVRGVVDTIAEKEKYDIVLQKESLPYVDSKLDITDQVIAALGKK